MYMLYMHNPNKYQSIPTAIRTNSQAFIQYAMNVLCHLNIILQKNMVRIATGRY